MKINFIYDSSCNAAPSAFKTALQAGADIIDKAIINPITVTIQVGWGENAGEIIDTNGVASAAPSPSQAPLTYKQLVNALTTTANSNNCSFLTANLPVTDPTGGLGQWTVYTAQAAALNLPVLNSWEIDGSIGFSAGINWGYSRTNLGANQIDFIGTVTHEITHALGRVSANTGLMSSQLYGANDLYTYASKGNLQLTTGKAGGYFSINGGATNKGNLDGSANGDSADWTVVTDDNGASANGVAGTFSFIDLQVMQALGFKMASSYQLAGQVSVDSPVSITASVNEGEHDLISVQTVGVTPGTTVNYSISGIAASRLISGKLSGSVTIGSDGTGTIDLGIANDFITDGQTTATVTLAGNLASTSVIVNDTSVTPNNAVTLTGNSTYTAQPNQTIIGTSGLNKVVFSEPASNFTVSISGSTATLVDKVGTFGTETLNNVERAVFNDGSLALDFQQGQNGHLTAMMIGTAFGASKVSAYFAAGVSLYDAGQTNLQVATLIEQLGLIESQIGSTSNTAWLDFVYKNVVGVAPDSASEASYVNALNNGTYTKASLLALAAGVADNGAGSLAAQINLVGLQAHGLSYYP